MTRAFVRWLSCALLLVACGTEVRQVPPTQVTARISAVDAVRRLGSELRVSVWAELDGRWQERDKQRYDFANVKWPIDLAIVPGAGTPRGRMFELIVEVSKSDGTTIVQQRALLSFVPRQQRVIDVVLESCAQLQEGQLCELNPECHGALCLTCVSNMCAPTPVFDDDDPSYRDLDRDEVLVDTFDGGPPPESMEAGPLPQADAAPDAPVEMDGGPNDGAPSTDAEPPVLSDGDVPDGAPMPTPTCATPGSGITCSVGNLCSGRETCEPTSASANASGCVPVPDVVCPVDQTCSMATGTCTPTPCATPDADGDGVASTQCGGTDCDDSDVMRTPGKPELCNLKDDDCSNVADDGAASASCTAPANGTATCSAGSCAITCSPNFDLVGTTCVARNFCLGVTACAPGSCTNGAAGYTCSCPAGTHTGTGTASCAEVDPCATAMGGCSHTCQKTGPGTHVCGCPSGLVLQPDQRTCAAPPPTCSTGFAPPGTFVTAAMPRYAQMTSVQFGMHDQYLCRVTFANGAQIPGKLNTVPSEPTRIEPTCYVAYLSSGLPTSSDEPVFEVYAPPSTCILSWVAHSTAASALPAGALALGKDAAGLPLYACRVTVSDAQSSGQHLGRVAGTPGASCLLQYFGSPRAETTFEVLISQ
jgi:hypothetical protein